MLVTPQEVRDYTPFETVKNRADAQLQMDILQAQVDVFDYCKHDFTDVKYTPIALEVKLAMFKLTEYYALINSDEGILRGIKSEKIGDYQYTLSDGTTQVFSISKLLFNFIKDGEERKSVRIRTI